MRMMKFDSMSPYEKPTCCVGLILIIGYFTALFVSTLVNFQMLMTRSSVSRSLLTPLGSWLEAFALSFVLFRAGTPPTVRDSAPESAVVPVFTLMCRVGMPSGTRGAARAVPFTATAVEVPLKLNP